MGLHSIMKLSSAIKLRLSDCKAIVSINQLQSSQVQSIGMQSINQLTICNYNANQLKTDRSNSID